MSEQRWIKHVNAPSPGYAYGAGDHAFHMPGSFQIKAVNDNFAWYRMPADPIGDGRAAIVLIVIHLFSIQVVVEEDDVVDIILQEADAVTGVHAHVDEIADEQRLVCVDPAEIVVQD